LIANAQCERVLVSGKTRAVRDGATEQRARWKAQREAFADLRAERAAARAQVFSQCADTRRRAVEVRAAAKAVRAASREQRKRSLLVTSEHQ
jgi:hypothetical protein